MTSDQTQDQAGDPVDRRSRLAFVLHGGGGPQTVAPISAHCAGTLRVSTPTHPGWNGTALPQEITSVGDLARAYLAHLRAERESDVVLLGSSIGGWIALEMAVQAAARADDTGLIGAVVLIDSVGVVVPGEPIADFFALDARGLAEAAWHDPERGYQDPADSTDEQRAVQLTNRRTMEQLAGRSMSDPGLLDRLGVLTVPTLVVWGDSDRVVTPAYGRGLAAAVPGARFVSVPEAGHLPHLENPEATWAAVDEFLGGR